MKCQTGKDKCNLIYMWNLKKQTNQDLGYREQIGGCQGGWGDG